MPIFVVNSALFLGLGRADLEFKIQVVKSGLVMVAIIGGLALGANGIAAGVSIGYGMAFAVCMRWAIRIGGISLSALIEAVQPPLTASAALVLGVFAVRFTCFQGFRLALELCMSVVTGCSIYFFVLYLLFRSQFLDGLLQMRILLRANPKAT